MVDDSPSPPTPAPLDPATSARRRFDDVVDFIPPSGILYDYCLYAAQVTDAPAFFHLGSILPVLAYEANHWDVTIDAVQAPFQWWSLLVATSGARKSHAIKMALDFGRESVWAGPPPRDPTMQLSGSVPGLIVDLREHHLDRARDRVHAVLYRDEFSDVLQRETDTPQLIELWDGATMNKKLVGQQKAHAKAGGTPDPNLGRTPNPRVTGVFATTLDTLRTVVTPQQRRGGLFARMCFIAAQQHPELLDPLPVTPDARRAARAPALQAWDGWLGWLQGGVAGGGNARVIHLPDDVKRTAIACFFERYRTEMAASEMGGVLGRAFTRIIQLAGLYAISRESWEIGDDDIAVALNMGERMLADTRTIFDALHDNPEMREAAQIIEAFARAARADGTTSLGMRQIIQLSGMHHRQVTNAMQHLIESGQLVQLPVKRPPLGSKGGRPALQFALTAGGIKPPSLSPPPGDEASDAPSDVDSVDPSKVN